MQLTYPGAFDKIIEINFGGLKAVIAWIVVDRS